VAFAFCVGDSLHLHGFEELDLVHEAGQGEGPAVTNSLEVLDLVFVDLDGGEGFVLGGLLSGGGTDEGLDDALVGVAAEDALVVHVLDHEGGGLVDGHSTGVDVEVGALGGLIGVRDTSELGDNAGASLGVESLDVTTFANLEGGGDVAFVEVKTSFFVEGLGEIAVLRVGADEGDKDDLAGHVEELGDFGNAADVLGTVLRGETEALVEASADNVAVKDEHLVGIADLLVEGLLEGLGEGGLSSAGEASEPVGGSLFNSVGFGFHI
jgi:hypothetical protein